ncbi:hypothetical protein HDV04_003096 [Boothiomyces sp. JEL0838]|nr:hypothetical protein HDV04_004345 [Boothiomyces sp. JEL0838]KAJ3312496.1 hypothetical protein HDV04_003096 [Boothiomyces sp. JEL0838]
MDEMKQLLMEGYVLLVDRYCYSEPDLVLFFDLDPELAIQRGDYGTERYEKLEFQKKVYSNFQKMSKGWTVIDSNNTKDKVFNSVREIIGSHLSTSKEFEYLEFKDE